MDEFLRKLIAEFGITQTKATDNALQKLVDSNRIRALSDQITEIKNQIKDIFVISKEKEEFKEKHFIIENAHAKKDYEFILNMQDFPNIAVAEIQNLESLGLQFDPKENKIFGKPLLSGSTDLHIKFFHKQDENMAIDVKTVTFIINADPKDLWKDIPSNQDTKWAKKDDITEKGTFLDKKFVVASRRGRSHAHEGKFRDDHFCMKSLPQDWAVMAVADGAGSATYAREGSRIATEFLCEQFDDEQIILALESSVVKYFSAPIENTQSKVVEKKSEFDESNAVPENHSIENDIPTSEENSEQTQESNIEVTSSESEEKKSAEESQEPASTPNSEKSLIVNSLYKVVRSVFQKLSDTATENNIALKDLNTTLIFTLVKKFDFGYAVLSFGVGDCPINVISEDGQKVELLNTLDVGDFGGGTRFLTMPEIYSNPTMGSRFGIYKFEDFSKMFLMTDGIYDPKFITENKLEDLDTWNSFLQDLDGENEDSAKVDFEDDSAVENQLLNWMDFWSKGNHDDRTLAIIY